MIVFSYNLYDVRRRIAEHSRASVLNHSVLEVRGSNLGESRILFNFHTSIFEKRHSHRRALEDDTGD